MIAELEEMTGAEMVGMIGHTGILFRQQSDPEKRRVIVPDREPSGDGGP
jgi:RNA-binding protein YhbY